MKSLIPILVLWSLILTSDAFVINCGSSTPHVSTIDQRLWQSDNNPAFASPNINSVSKPIPTGVPDDDLPFQVARLFWSPLTYTFPLSPGPYFIRLYFSTSISYNNIPPYQFSISAVANNFTLLQNFNPYLNSPQNLLSAPQKPLNYEFQIIVQDNLNLTFSPGHNITTTMTTTTINNNNNLYYGYVNGIVILPVPDRLYIKINDPTQYKSVPPGPVYAILKSSSAFQTLYRLNVGGEDVNARNDSPGGMMRSWDADDKYLSGDLRGAKIEPPLNDTRLNVNYTKKTTAYVAPKSVYASTRIMGGNASFNIARNLTWMFEVDPGFDYIVRLLFREMDRAVTGMLQRFMWVYIGGLDADQNLDVWSESGGFGVPMYKDYAISIDGRSDGLKVPLSLALHPSPGLQGHVEDVFLNGLEILKLSSNENLAVPNPPYNASNAPQQNQTTTPKSSNHKTLIAVIGGVIGAVLLAFLILLALCRRRVEYKKLFTSTKSSSKGRLWFPASTESQTSSATTNTNSSRPSLPSDLCRRFSLSQIQVATSDFDEKSVIGTGGFGKVYKGCVDDGATTVAIKRLNPLSKQGAHEFFTEIEMLSRLRHMHLVTLIGYCDDQGEMILVYEYMPRGTLRDHLKYKDANKDNVDDEVLSWNQRLMICIGSARGLDYLHSGTKQLIIHRDVKSTNILLDDKWTAKVSDFGLSKVGPASETGIGHVSTAVKGSIGYLDPEYYRRRQLTEKSDVYSFGVVLFEVLCARQVVSPNLPREQVSLANWGKSCYKRGILNTIVDPNLTGQIAPECLKKFGEIAEMCIRNDGDDRPSMRDVVWSLEFALTLQKTAEKNSSDGSSMVEVTRGDGVANGGSDGGSTDNVVFTNSLEENISQSGGARLDAKGFGSYSTSSNLDSATTTNHHDDMRSGLVFSEILDPRGR